MSLIYHFITGCLYNRELPELFDQPVVKIAAVRYAVPSIRKRGKKVPFFKAFVTVLLLPGYWPKALFVVHLQDFNIVFIHQKIDFK